MIPAWLNRLVNLGTTDQSPSAELRQVRLTNATALFAMLSVALYDILYLVLAPSMAWATVSVSVVFLSLYVLVLSLGKRRHLRAAKLVHLSTTLAALMVATVFGAGTGPGVQYYFFIFAILPALLWSPRDWPYVAVFFVLTLAGYLYVEIVPPVSFLTAPLPRDLIPWFRFPAVVASFLTVVAVVLISQGQVERRETVLEAQGEEIREQNRWKDRLFGIVAHDLRNPFSGFETSLRLLVKEYDVMSEQERKQWLGLLLDTSTQTGRLLEGMVLWASDLMLSSQAKPQDFRLEDVVREEVAGLLPMADHKQIRLTWEGTANLRVRADPDMTKTLLRNLLTNALKFTAVGGRVLVTAEPAGDQRWRINVSDTGVGIEPDRLARLFDSDKRQSTRGTQQETGTGLGLILCRDFARKNGGELTIRSVAGHGSVFSFDLQRGGRSP